MPLATLAALLGAGPIAAAGLAADASATVTFYRDVLPILQESCQVCHRPGGANLGGMIAPMPLTSFEEVRPWAKAIARSVQARVMPPWDAAPAFNGHFANERTLSEAEIETLVRWAGSGAAAGKREDGPEPRVFPLTDGWQIGEPDLIVAMPEPYFVPDEVEDHYVTFEVPIGAEQLSEDRYLKAVEFRPGGPAVHHMLAGPLGGIAPGNEPLVLPDGFGLLLRKGTVISLNMHYYKEPGPGTGLWDRSQVGVKLYPPGYQPRHQVRVAELANLEIEIPAGDPEHQATTSFTFDREVMVLSYLPHMHLRGKSARYLARHPDGSEVPLLEVPQYDFNWQTTYTYREPKVLPAGTRVELTTTWDNSAANPANPDPSRRVVFGQRTTDEMMYGFLSYVYVEEPAPLEVAASDLERFVGTYAIAGGEGEPPSLINIGTNAGVLTAQFPGQAGDVVFDLVAESTTTHTLGVAAIEMVFVEAADGRVGSFLFRRHGSEMVAERVR